MGQMASSLGQDPDGAKEKAVDLESFSKEQLAELFINKCLLVLNKSEVNLILTKLNTRNINEKQILTLSDFRYLLQLEGSTEEDNLELNEEFKGACKHIYESFKVIGSFPFIQDYLFDGNSGLTINELVVASLFHTGKYRSFLGDGMDYSKLFFISLCLPKAKHDGLPDKPIAENAKSSEISEKAPGGYTDSYVLEVYKTQSSVEDIKDMASQVKWDTFYTKDFEVALDVDKFQLRALDLLHIVVLALMTSLVKHDHPHDFKVHLTKNILNEKKWHSFKKYAMSVMKYIRLDLNEKNIANSYISFSEFKQAFSSGFQHLFPTFFHRILVEGLLSPLALPGSTNSGSRQKQTLDNTKSRKESHIKFKESRLVDEAFLSLAATIISSSGFDVEIGSKNMVMLYSGADQGFSIRSLESKVFKWRAPSIFIVAGKRLKAKTMANNKRYQQFDLDYRKIFRPNENPKREWQEDTDKITYAVLVHPPWRTSNKKNFGDEKCMILSILPRADYYKSVHNPLLKGESVYFNNLGMGIGFGNDQPINKNGVKKYLPGDISLTIESNLEFAVFRHLANISTNAPKHFAKSTQQQVQGEDFEDRFIITDLEVWGIGSTKELDEQRKQWEWEKKQAEARQNINLKNLGEERAFLEMVGLAGNHNSSGGSV